KRERGMKWFYLISFIAGCFICVSLSSLLVFALVTRGFGGLRAATIFLLQIALFAYITRQMFLWFKGNSN
ncbi:MAG: hypothetical protein WBX02_17710, partial [Terriglobales bacterium]